MSRSGAGPRLSIAPTAPQLTLEMSRSADKKLKQLTKDRNGETVPGETGRAAHTIARNFISASISRHVTAPHFFA